MTWKKDTAQMTIFSSNDENSDWLEEFLGDFNFDFAPGWQDKFGNALNRYTQTKLHAPINTLSLFSGAGGLDIGFHDAGFSINNMVEIDERFVKTLNANTGKEKYFEETEAICCDIRDYHPPNDLSVDFIIGGPPCQTFSAAGRRAAGVQGTKDDRGTLFQEYIRLLMHLKPKGFLFENVYGIAGAENGKAWEAICSGFKSAGYEIYFRILDAADYGVPQHRERMFIVGVRDGGYLYSRPTHGPDSYTGRPHFTASEAINGAAATVDELEAKVGGRYGHLLEEIPPGLNYSFFTENMGHPNPIFAWRSKFSDFLYKADPDTPVRTLKAQGGQYTGPFHWGNRPFSIKELKRLQTFPDTYKISGGKQAAIHQIGNSVPPQLARVLAVSILIQIYGLDFPYNFPLLQENEELGFRKRKRRLTAIYQEKARKAIEDMKISDNSMKMVERSYLGILTKNFSFKESAISIHSIKVEIYPTDRYWEFNIGNTHTKSNFLEIKSADEKNRWALPVEKVSINFEELNESLYTAGWKAFENELIRYGFKADLVQLCNYYQYPPTFKCEMVLDSNTSNKSKWRTLKAVIEGKGTRKIMPYENLAELYQIEIEEVLELAKWLKSMGYEVRNHRTNPQIPNDNILIPYAFPTLNPLSVQLKKSLGAYNGQ
jgi:DNA (cytosine-5)-methyltransferase 1